MRCPDFSVRSQLLPAGRHPGGAGGGDKRWWNPNASAGEKSTRSLRDYCLGVVRDPNNPDLSQEFPPPLFIKGPLALDYGGTHWDLTPLRPYVALSPDAVGDIQPTTPVPYLLTIENLAIIQTR